ncbi:MAG: glycosyltransferase family 39 protein [Planctomycetes bacterium]|nr:glycosyltransferase family 39 protein [Planctomycetota bacterium]
MPGTHSAKLRVRLRRLRIAAPLLAAVVAVLAALNGYSRSYATLPWLDECNYLNEANWIAEHGGAAGFLGETLHGGYPYDSRNPGLPLLGSYVTDRSLAGVRPFRALNAVLCFAALMGIYVLAARCVNARTGLFVVAVLAASGLWTDASAILGVEPFVYLPFFAAWFFLAGFSQAKRRWFWAGLAAGVAYFFKGTANLLVMTMALAICWEFLWRLRQRPGAPGLAEPWRAWWQRGLRACGVFAFGGFLGAWPVFINHALRFGNPFHNKNASVMWMDVYDQRLAEGDFSPLGYLRAHSLADCAQRLYDGMGQQWNNLCALFGGPFSPWSLAAPLLLGLAAYGLWSDPGRWRRNVTLALTILVILLFAWWARFGNVGRFTATVGPMLAVFAALGAARLARKLPVLKRSRPVLVFALPTLFFAGACGGLTWGTQPDGLASPSAPLKPTEKYAHLLRWFEAHPIAKGEPTLVTDYFRPRYDLFWLLPQPPRSVVLIRPYADYASFMDSDQGRAAKYLVIELNTWRKREALLAPFLRTDAAGRTFFALPGWRLVDGDQYPPAPDYLIYQRVEAE